MADKSKNRPEPMEVRAVGRAIGECLIQGERADYDLGRLIARVKSRRMWRWWNDHGGPFPNFERWVWAVCGFRSRKAGYLQANYRALSAMYLAEDSMSRALRLGWTKLSKVVRVAHNETELLAWIDRIEGVGGSEPMSEEDLRAAIAVELGSVGDPDATGEESESEEPLEASGSRRPKTETVFRRATLPITFTQEEHLSAFMSAVKVLRNRVDPDMGYGEVAGLMALEYVGSALRDDEGGIVVELEEHLKRLEATWGKRLGIRVVVDEPETSAIEPVAAASPHDEALDF